MPGDENSAARLARGIALHRAGRLEDAERVYQDVINATPADSDAVEAQRDSADAMVSLGGALARRGAYAEAEPWLQRALALKPDPVSALIELAAMRVSEGALDDATAALTRALELAPADKAALMNLAYLRVLYADFAAAQGYYRRAIAIAGTDLRAARFRLLALLYDPAVTEAERAAAHREFGALAAAQIHGSPPPATNDRDPHQRLRIGYLSADMYVHPVARNLEPLLAHRDRARFEIFAYAYYGKEDATTARLRDLSDVWRPTIGLTDDQVAAQIRADRIDILLLLAGRFDRNRPQIAAHRAAPVQISFHDPGPSGIAAMDYFITDSVMAPRHTPELFTERVLRLPNFYLHAPLTEAPEIGPPPAEANGYVTFGSLNNPAKLNDRVLGLWGEILRLTPRARLRLKFKNWFANQGLRAHVLAALGVDAARVEFAAGDNSAREHLALYNAIDVALDPAPFSGSTTSFEALWMGVPIVTLAGDHLAARWTSSMIRRVGLGDLAAESPQAYVATALKLAADRARLRDLRLTLRELVARSPLCDGARGAAFRTRVARDMAEMVQGRMSEIPGTQYLIQQSDCIYPRELSIVSLELLAP